MRYAVARFNVEQRDMAYRIYLSECARMIANNTARLFGGSGLDIRFSDLIRNKRMDNRSAKEIAADVIKRAGIEVIKS